jgi:hypothetical protein
MTSPHSPLARPDNATRKCSLAKLCELLVGLADKKSSRALWQACCCSMLLSKYRVCKKTRIGETRNVNG